MTTGRRWSIAILAATIVVVAGAGESDDETYEQRLARIEQLGPGEKKELFNLEQRFRNLAPQKQAELRKLHEDLLAHENREELERVMHAYYEWVSTLDPLEKAQLDTLSPQERIARVVKYMSSPDRRSRPWGPWGPGGPGRPPRGPGFGRGVDPTGLSHAQSEILRRWIGQYVLTHGDQLAAILAPEEREKWTATWRKACSEEVDKEKALWRATVSWYLASPKKDLPLLADDVEEFKKLLPPETRSRLNEIPQDRQIQGIQESLKGLLRWQFFVGHDDVKGLITPEQLEDFRRNGLTEGQKDYLRRPHVRDNIDLWLQGFYLFSKVPSQHSPFGDREGRRSFERGGGPRGSEPGRGGASGSGRGPGGDFRDRFDGRGPEGRPELQPPPGDRPMGPGFQPPPE